MPRGALDEAHVGGLRRQAQGESTPEGMARERLLHQEVGGRLRRHRQTPHARTLWLNGAGIAAKGHLLTTVA